MGRRDDVLRGFALEIGDWIDQYPNEVIAVVCDASYPLDEVKGAIETCPFTPAVWVIRDRDRVAKQAFEELGIDPVVVPLNDWYKNEKVDVRRVIREGELMMGCTHILVFRASEASSKWVGRPSARADIRIVGDAPKKKR